MTGRKLSFKVSILHGDIIHYGDASLDGEDLRRVQRIITAERRGRKRGDR
jgi:hypothetical protein